MWWKRGFIILLALNVLVFAGGLIALDAYPSASSTGANTNAPQQPTSNETASVQISIGQNAINTYLDYALSQLGDVHNIMNYARVQFSDNWSCDIGVKLLNRVVPFHIVFVPTVVNGDLHLQVQSAVMGQVPVPDSLLFLVLKHLPWPNWIALDPTHHTIQLNFTQRPQNPYGVSILGYSAKSQLLNLKVTMVPKELLHSSTQAPAKKPSS